MKKLLSLLLSAILVFSICSFSASAKTPASNSDFVISYTSTGRLIDKRGNVTLVTGYRRNTPMATNMLSDNYSVSYDYTIPLNNLTHEDKITGTDKTYYLKASLTVYYTEYDRTPKEYLMTGVSASWSDPLPTDRTFVDKTGTISAMSDGIGSTAVWPGESMNVSVTSNQYVDTGFVYPIGDSYGMMGATLTIGIHMGQESWTLELENYPI